MRFLNNFQVEMRRQSGLPTVLAPDLGVYTFHFNKQIHAPKDGGLILHLQSGLFLSVSSSRVLIMLCNAPSWLRPISAACIPVDEA